MRQTSRRLVTRAPSSHLSKIDTSHTEAEILTESDRKIGMLFHDIARLRIRIYDATIKDTGLTHAQVFVINHLLKKNGMSQVELAGVLGMGVVGVSELVDRMEQRGWVERRPDPNDKRAKQVWLCARVKRLLPKVLAAIHALNAQTVEGLSKREIDALITNLQRIRRNLWSTAMLDR